MFTPLTPSLCNLMNNVRCFEIHRPNLNLKQIRVSVMVCCQRERGCQNIKNDSRELRRGNQKNNWEKKSYSGVYNPVSEKSPERFSKGIGECSFLT